MKKVTVFKVENKKGKSKAGQDYDINIAYCQSFFSKHPDVPFTFELLVDKEITKGKYVIDDDASLYIDRGRLAFRAVLKPQV